MNSVAALCGFLLYPRHHSGFKGLLLGGGVLLLAAAASALNQILDRDLDGLMLRTHNRPLPAGRLTIRSAAVAGIATSLGGVTLLAAGGGYLPPLLGVITLLIYLGLYTPLKRHTTMALPIGALCGAIPPLIGWSMAGGVVTDFRAVILCGLFFIWQMPHFWLLQERYRDDYRRANLPLRATSPALLQLWVAALGATLLLLPLFGLLTNAASLLLATLPLLLVMFSLFHKQQYLFTGLSVMPLLLALLLYLP